jgi:VWFA-related protein
MRELAPRAPVPWFSRMRVLPLVLLSLAAAPAPQPRATFSSRADLVVVHVTVLDKRAGFVSGLPRDVFTVQENDRPQPIAFFEHEDTPVTVGLVIDSSQSMAPRRDAVIAAGMAFAESSHPGDELFTVNFNEHVWPGLPRGLAFTRDHAELRDALAKSGSRGKTALFDALQAALRHLDGASESRKVLIVVSDGGDNASSATFDQVLDAALRRDVVIYAIGLAHRDDDGANPEVLKKLAAVTGGEAFFPKANKHIAPAMERVARDIRSSYTLGFVPSAEQASSSPRRIRVDVKADGERKFTVRARTLALAPGDSR